MDFVIDSHFHIWDREKFDYPFLTPARPKLNRDITAKEYEENTTGTQVKCGVFVQCLNNKPEEAEWVLQQAQQNPFIKGVVAGLNVTDEIVLKKQLENLVKYEEFVGFRHLIDFEPMGADWLTQESVKRGFEILGQYGLTVDLALRPHLLQYMPKLVSSLPSQKFVVNHLAMPYIKDKKIEPWKTELAEIAKFPNVYCKFAGLLTEADFQNWTENDLKPYVDHVIDIFGADRLMYGSDWPVSTEPRDSEYKDTFLLANKLLSHLSEKEKTAIFKDNAIKFYNLKI